MMGDNPGFKARLYSMAPYLALFILAALLYMRSVGFEFIPSWDDDEYVLDNVYIFSLSLKNLKAIFSTTVLGNYAPLHILSYAFDHALWGLDPRGFHLTNVLLHAFNACALYAVIRRITGKAAVGFVAALLFAVHPLNVENVAWVTERKTLLATLFVSFSLLSYLRFRERRSPAAYVLCLVFFIIALLSKPIVVTFPLLLLAYEFYLRREDRVWLPVLPLFVLSGVAAAGTVLAHIGSRSIAAGTFTYDVLFGVVYPTMLPIYWKYVGLIIWPFNLSGYYDTTQYHSFVQPYVAISLFGWVLCFLAVFLKGSARVRFWFLWFWIWFLPVSNLVPIPVYYADRYMYLPAIAFFVLVGEAASAVSIGGVSRAGHSMPGRGIGWVRARTGLKSILVYGVVAAIVVYYGAVAFDRLGVWRNQVAFWEDTARKSPNLYKSRLNLGFAYEMAGEYSRAEREYLAAITIDPTDEAVSNLKMLRVKLKLYEKR